MLEERRFEKDSFINLQTQDTFTAYEGQWEGHRRRFAGLMSKVSQMKMSDQDRSTFEQIDRDFQEYTRGYEAVVAQIRTGMVQTARQANDAIGPFKSAAHRIEADSNAVRERAELRLIKTL
jgi:methyl-accepting chemotaxis protein